VGKYVLVYQGGAMAETEEAQQASMAAWGQWFGSLGSAVVDGGAPFGPSSAVGGGTPKTGLTGYSILTADDLDAAVQLASGCPIVSDGGSVDVYETIDVGAG
jgi:YCII-related domain